MKLFFLLTMPDFSSPEIWISLLTLTFLEIVLGVDNIIFITIAANRLEAKQQARARNIGLFLAMIFRVILLFGISYLIALSKPIINFSGSFFSLALSRQYIIQILGGIFLLYKSVSEIHHKLERHGPEDNLEKKSIANSLSKVIVQITLINIVF